MIQKHLSLTILWILMKIGKPLWLEHGNLLYPGVVLATEGETGSKGLWNVLPIHSKCHQCQYSCRRDFTAIILRWGYKPYEKNFKHEKSLCSLVTITFSLHSTTRKELKQRPLCNNKNYLTLIL